MLLDQPHFINESNKYWIFPRTKNPIKNYLILKQDAKSNLTLTAVQNNKRESIKEEGDSELLPDTIYKSLMEQIGEKTTPDQAIQIDWKDFNALFGVEYLVNGIQEFLIDPETKEIEYNFVEVRENIEGYVFSAETGEDFLTLYAKSYNAEITSEIESRFNIRPTGELQTLRQEIFEKEEE